MFEYFVTVRGYELDSYNHVNNAVYLNYLEQSRWEILKQLKLLDYFRKNELLLVVIDIHIRYIREAIVFDELVIKTIIETKSPYIIFKHTIYNTKTGLKVSKADVKTLLIDKEKNPCDMPEGFYKKLTS